MGIFGFLKRNKKDAEQKPADEPVREPEKEEVAYPAEEVEKPRQTEPAAKAVEKPFMQPAEQRAESGKVLVKVAYNRSFTAKLIQSDDKFKSYYGEIKNELMRYGVKSRVSWRFETFKKGRKLLARIAARGKTLGLYLALDPAEYVGTKYKVDDVSQVAKNAEVPVLYKIKNDRRCKYAKELIAAVMAANGLTAGEALSDDYAARYPYEETEPLIERGLIKLSKTKRGAEEAVIEISEDKYAEIAAAEDYPETVESITVAEAEERIDDDVAETFVKESERISDRTKKDIVNIDALGKYFDDGETVTVEEIRKRVPAVHAKTTYIKVLARGKLDKALNVEADDFSPAAIKMIVLTGGTVTRTRK